MIGGHAGDTSGVISRRVAYAPAQSRGRHLPEVASVVGYTPIPDGGQVDRLLARGGEGAEAGPWPRGRRQPFHRGRYCSGLLSSFALTLQRPELPSVSAWYERLRMRFLYASYVMVPLT